MIRILTYRLPFRAPFRASGRQWTHRSGLLLEWADGKNGWVSEAAPLPGRSPESLEEVIEVVREQHSRLSDWIQGKQAVPDHLPPSLRFALSALRLQVQESLKVADPSDPARSGSRFKPASLRVNGVIGLGSPEELKAALQTQIRNGYTSIKVKLDDAPEEQIEVLREQTNVFPQLRLRIDANRSWNRDEAAHWLDALSSLPIDYCEEPLIDATLDDLETLQQATGVTIALDESLSTLAVLREAVRRHDLSTFVLKATTLGDLDQIGHTLRESTRPIRTVWTTTLESAVARTTLRRAALEWGSLDTAHGLDTGSLFEQDLVATGMTPAAEHGPERPASLNRHWALPSRMLDRSLLHEVD